MKATIETSPTSPNILCQNPILLLQAAELCRYMHPNSYQALRTQAKTPVQPLPGTRDQAEMLRVWVQGLGYGV